ncbi:MAG: VWA domain-containing protein [Planctomycetota bacterium]
MIALAAPWVLLLLAAPVLVRLLARPHRAEHDAVYAPFVGRLAEALGQAPASAVSLAPRRRVQALAFAVVWGLIVLALARPQWVGDPLERTLATRDLLLAVDLSGSMETEDFTDDSGRTVDRLTAVKQVLDDFLARREGDRVGLVFFGNAAFVQAPFTDDLEVCRLLLGEAQVRMAGPKTALGDAIGLAIGVFDESELDERVLIALTDGNDTASRIPPAKAAAIASDRGITIHTVAVGDPEAAGEERLDERTLEQVAQATGGEYAFAADREQLEAVYARLDALDTRDAQVQTYRPRTELFAWPLGLATLLSWLLAAALHLPRSAWSRVNADTPARSAA